MSTSAASRARIRRREIAAAALTGDLTRNQVIDALTDLRFDAQFGFTQPLIVDRDVRDLLVEVLRRPRA
jgi:hypothetical protein